ncbi:hypothetical protein Ac2012v2_001413 [Leucoagaricus gongylophorus]
MNWFIIFRKGIDIIISKLMCAIFICLREEGSSENICLMSDSPAGTSAPSFSYIEFAPARSRKKRKDRTQRQEPTVTLIQGIRNEMAHSDWFSQSQSIVKEALKFRSVKPSVSVLCLGLGSPSTSPNSRAQLSFLIELCAALDIDHTSVSIYDPIFTPQDLQLFEWLHFQILPNDEYPLQGPTIGYMPHCDMELYNNFFKANWSQDRLLTLILLANHLQTYLENNPHHQLQKHVPYLFKIAPNLDGHPLPFSKAWPTAFNNIAIQYIQPNKLYEGWFTTQELSSPQQVT